MKKKAVILLSGGLDSATCLAIAAAEGFDCYAISFCYDQRSTAELDSAKAICADIGVVTHKIFQIDIGQFGGSALTDRSIDIPEEETAVGDIPMTYVPARNTVFLSIALGWAEVIGARDIFLGANVLDYSGYPDCRPEYLEQFQVLANLATKCGVENDGFRIRAPLIELSKAQIIQRGLELGVDYAKTCSCYDADSEGRACGRCESCVLRKKGFSDCAIEDPTRYKDL